MCVHGLRLPVWAQVCEATTRDRRRRTRAFVALGLPQAQREEIGRYVERGAQLAPDYRWVEQASLHLTLRFLGHLEPEALLALRTGLRKVQAAPFKLGLGGLGSFGGRRSPRVLWLAVAAGADGATELARQVEAVCREVGLEEEKSFRPHLTLARARVVGRARLPELPPPPRLSPWLAEEFILYESRLGGGPPRYTPIELYPLTDTKP